jgi:hypothetical protein
LKTTPIPVKFDRQGHPCNFYAGFGPTGSRLQQSTLLAPNPARAKAPIMHVLFVHDLSCGFAFRVSETVGEKALLARRDVLLRDRQHHQMQRRHNALGN